MVLLLVFLLEFFGAHLSIGVHLLNLQALLFILLRLPLLGSLLLVLRGLPRLHIIRELSHEGLLSLLKLGLNLCLPLDWVRRCRLQGFLFSLLLLFLFPLLCELLLEALHVVEEAVVSPLALVLVALLLLLLLLGLVFILLLLLQLQLVQLLLQQLFSHLQLLALFYPRLIFLLLLFNTITNKLIGRWALLSSFAKTFESGLTLFHCLQDFFQGISSFQGLRTLVSS